MGTYSLEDQTYFNKFGGGYSPYSERDLDAMMEPFADIMTDHTGKSIRICEVGCASGQFSQMLARRFGDQQISFYGVDIALQVLSLYPHCKICGSAFFLPFKAASFDIICLPATLHHLSPFLDSISEIKRILAPGGHFFCMEPNWFHPQRFLFMRWRFLYRLWRRANDVPIHPDKLMGLLGRLGFNDIRMKYLNLYFEHPSPMQRIQNGLSGLITAPLLKKHLMPWFILVARKR